MICEICGREFSDTSSAGSLKVDEMETYLQEKGLLSVHMGTEMKTYASGEKVYRNGSWENMTNVFGIYKGPDGRYCFFITDAERGIPEYSGVFEKEEQACEALLRQIERSERIYAKSAK